MPIQRNAPIENALYASLAIHFQSHTHVKLWEPLFVQFNNLDELLQVLEMLKKIHGQPYN